MHFLTPKQQRWRKRWPAGLVAVLATVQLLLTFVIISLETTSLIFDFYYSMSFAGFYCSLFFMVTWISMFTVTCCNRHSSCCAIHVLVENILSIIPASVLLYFDDLFHNNPYTCLYGSVSDCSGFSYNSYYSDIYGIYSSTGYTVKMACIKAQLSCGVVMVVTNISYIIIFIVVAVKTRNRNNQVEMFQYGAIPLTVGVQSMIYQTQVPHAYVLPVAQQDYQSSGQHLVECHKCHTLTQIA